MRYVQRDGVTRRASRGGSTAPTPTRPTAEPSSIAPRPAATLGSFGDIVSPEDGAEYDDLKPLIRRLMTQVEADLDTRLDWVAVDHHNTGHPHTHVIVRGRDDLGHELVIAKDYLTQGLRERAAELVSLDLGPRTDPQIEGRLAREVDQARLTSLDRALLRGVEADGLVSPRHGSASPCAEGSSPADSGAPGPGQAGRADPVAAGRRPGGYAAADGRAW